MCSLIFLLQADPCFLALFGDSFFVIGLDPRAVTFFPALSVVNRFILSFAFVSITLR